MAEDPKLVLVKWHADVAHLHDLLHREGWDTYMGYVNRVITEEMERTLAIPPGLAGGVSDYQRGVIAGLRRAIQLPTEIIKNTQHARNN